MPTHTKTKQKHAMSLLTFAQDKLRQAKMIKENQFGVFTLGLYAADHHTQPTYSSFRAKSLTETSISSFRDV